MLALTACLIAQFPFIIPHVHKCKTMAISTMVSVQEPDEMNQPNKTIMLKNASVHKQQTYSIYVAEDQDIV